MVDHMIIVDVAVVVVVDIRIGVDVDVVGVLVAGAVVYVVYVLFECLFFS